MWVRYPRTPGLVETWHGEVGPEDVAWFWAQVCQAALLSELIGLMDEEIDAGRYGDLWPSLFYPTEEEEIAAVGWRPVETS